MLNNDYDSISNQGGFLNVLCCWWMAPVIAYWYCPDPVILECECLLLIDVHSFPGFFMFNLLLSAYCWREVCGGKRFVTAKFVVRRSRRKKVQWTALTNHQGHSFILSTKRNEEQFLDKLTKSLVNHS